LWKFASRRSVVVLHAGRGMVDRQLLYNAVCSVQVGPAEIVGREWRVCRIDDSRLSRYCGSKGLLYRAAKTSNTNCQ